MGDEGLGESVLLEKVKLNSPARCGVHAENRIYFLPRIGGELAGNEKSDGIVSDAARKNS